MYLKRMSNSRNLRHSKVYLCGQVEHDFSNAASWRTEIASDLKAVDPDIIVWDPLIKPTWMPADSRNDKIAFNKRDMFKTYYEADDVPEATRLGLGRRGWMAGHTIRRVCKKLASASDFMIARVSKTFTWGSIDELEIAARDNKPIFFWLPDGPISTYGLPGCIPDYELIDSYVFYEKENLISAIRAVNDGTSALLQKDPFAWTYLTYPNSIHED